MLLYFYFGYANNYFVLHEEFKNDIVFCYKTICICYYYKEKNLYGLSEM